MILQIRTDTFYAIEMTETQIQELSLVFEGLQETDIVHLITCMKGENYRGLQGINETVRAFRSAIAGHQKV